MFLTEQLHYLLDFEVATAIEAYDAFSMWKLTLTRLYTRIYATSIRICFHLKKWNKRFKYSIIGATKNF